MSIDATRAAALSAVPHGFLGRRGGVSAGELAGLNVSFANDDDRAAVIENRRRAIDAVLPGAGLVTVHQVHSATAVYASEAWPQDSRPHADALVTDRPGLLLGIMTADCAPVLLADAEAGVVGAAHAGWRGAFRGVCEAVIEAMERIGARRERIAAGIGPCIAQQSYEVDEAFRHRFISAESGNVRFFSQEAGAKPHFDLAGYAGHRLRLAGVGQIEALRLDTYADADRFFSYRRATHLGEADYGRQISLIGMSN